MWKGNQMKTVNILGTEYSISVQTEEENEKLEEADGLCEVYANKLVLRLAKNEKMNYDNFNEYEKKTLRHEIVHAFFAESGLRGNSDYAENEELVDWIAIQFPKILKAYQEVGCL